MTFCADPGSPTGWSAYDADVVGDAIAYADANYGEDAAWDLVAEAADSGFRPGGVDYFGDGHVPSPEEGNI